MEKTEGYIFQERKWLYPNCRLDLRAYQDSKTSLVGGSGWGDYYLELEKGKQLS
jgi:hypothetical protein